MSLDEPDKNTPVKYMGRSNRTHAVVEHGFDKFTLLSKLVKSRCTVGAPKHVGGTRAHLCQGIGRLQHDVKYLAE